jgi:hypothetical protein
MRRVIRKRIRRSEAGIDLAADVNAVIVVNHGDDRTHTSASTRQEVVERPTGGAERDGVERKKEG